MSPRLRQWCDRFDALSVRERVSIFIALVAAPVFMCSSLVLKPLLARESALRAEIAQNESAVRAINNEIMALVEARAIDPDVAGRARLAAINQEIGTLSAATLNMRTGLVAPERIAPMLEAILKANGKLRLVTLATLPVSPVLDNTPALAGATPAIVSADQQVAAAVLHQAGGAVATDGAGAAPAAPAVSVPLLYRHGVELTVRGNYLDMVSYLDALEAMPTQLIWGKADLVVEAYPNARLTLSVYTLSVDKKWMKL